MSHQQRVENASKEGGVKMTKGQKMQAGHKRCGMMEVTWWETLSNMNHNMVGEVGDEHDDKGQEILGNEGKSSSSYLRGAVKLQACEIADL